MERANLKFCANLLQFATVAFFLFFTLGCEINTEVESLSVAQKEDRLLADSLTTIYTKLISAAQKRDSAAIRSLLDPEEIITLTGKAHNYGHRSLGPFLAWIVNDWPNMKVQKVTEIKKSTPYVRLTLTNNENSALYASDGILRLSFLLFKRNSNRWEFVTLSRLNKEKQGLYGYALSYHETDLPPELRFPRRF